MSDVTGLASAQVPVGGEGARPYLTFKRRDTVGLAACRSGISLDIIE